MRPTSRRPTIFIVLSSSDEESAGKTDSDDSDYHTADEGRSESSDYDDPEMDALIQSLGDLDCKIKHQTSISILHLICADI